MNARHRMGLVLAGCLLLAGAALLTAGAGIGSTGFESVLQARRDAVSWQIVWEIRLPRTLGAWLAGALLGLTGAAFAGAVVGVMLLPNSLENAI